MNLHNDSANINMMSSTQEIIQKMLKSFKFIGDYVKEVSAPNSSTCSVLAAFFIIENKSEDIEEVLIINAENS